MTIVLTTKNWTLTSYSAQLNSRAPAGVLIPPNATPAISGAPSTLEFTAGVGGTYNFSQHCTDSGGEVLAYSLPVGYGGVSISAVGAIIVSSSAAITTGTSVTVRVTDPGGLFAEHSLSIVISAAAYVVSVSGSTVTTQKTASGQSWVGTTINGGTIGASPGAVIEIQPGTYPPLVFTNFNGTQASPIIIRNGSGQIIVRRSSPGGSGFIIEYRNCVGVTFDFSYSAYQFGLVVTSPSSSDSPTSYIKCTGVNRWVTWKSFEIDGLRTSWTSGTTPIGFQAQDVTLAQVDNQGVWQQQDVIFEDFNIHNVAGEGMYIGPNFSQSTCPLRNVTIRNGVVTDTGRDGIQLKSAYEGLNEIYGNTVTRGGRNTNDSQAGQLFGISVNSGVCNIHDNAVYDSGESGIQVYTHNGPLANTSFYGYGPYAEFECEFYNNLIVNSGVVNAGNSNIGHGITIGAGSASFVLPRGYAYNNTCVENEGDGINFGSNTEPGWIRNNVLLDNAGGAYSLGGSTQANNKTTGSLTAQYRLTAEDAAVGTVGVDISATDLNNVSRSGTASKGAYEYA